MFSRRRVLCVLALFVGLVSYFTLSRRPERANTPNNVLAADLYLPAEPTPLQRLPLERPHYTPFLNSGGLLTFGNDLFTVPPAHATPTSDPEPVAARDSATLLTQLNHADATPPIQPGEDLSQRTLAPLMSMPPGGGGFGVSGFSGGSSGSGSGSGGGGSSNAGCGSDCSSGKQRSGDDNSGQQNAASGLNHPQEKESNNSNESNQSNESRGDGDHDKPGTGTDGGSPTGQDSPTKKSDIVQTEQPVQSVPEPATLLLIGVGLGSGYFAKRARRRSTH